MAPILKCSLPSTGIVCTYPCPLVHGPTCYMGLDIPNLNTEQTILHILQALCVSDKSDIMAFLLRICGKSMQLELGWAGKLLDAPVCLQQVVMSLWLKHVWLMTQSFNIHIHTRILLPPPRQGDIEVMRLFLQHGYHNPDALLPLNHCQMYLHAFWLYLCTGMGDSIAYGLG